VRKNRILFTLSGSFYVCRAGRVTFSALKGNRKTAKRLFLRLYNTTGAALEGNNPFSATGYGRRDVSRFDETPCGALPWKGLTQRIMLDSGEVVTLRLTFGQYGSESPSRSRKDCIV